MADGMVDSVFNVMQTVVEFRDCLVKFKDKPGMVLSILQELENLKTISYMVLKETSVGKTVNGFRKADGPIGELAKTLVARWKDLASAAIKSNECQPLLANCSTQKVMDSAAINKKLSERYNTAKDSKVKVEKPEPDSQTSKVTSERAVNEHKNKKPPSKHDRSVASVETTKIKKEKMQIHTEAATEKSSGSVGTAQKVKKEKSSGTSSEKASDLKSLKIKKEKLNDSEVPVSTQASTFEDALLVKTEKKHKKSKSKAKIKKEPKDSGRKVSSPSRKNIGLSDLPDNTASNNNSSNNTPDSTLDSGEDLAALHGSVTFSKHVYDTPPVKVQSSAKEPSTKKSENNQTVAKKKTLALSEYKLLTNVKKEKSTDGNDSNGSEKNSGDLLDEIDKSHKLATKRCLSDDDRPKSDTDSSKAKLPKSENSNELDASLNKLQSDLDHFLNVYQSKQNDSAQLSDDPKGALRSMDGRGDSKLISDDKPASSKNARESQKQDRKLSSVPKAYAENVNSDCDRPSSSKHDNHRRSSKSGSDRHLHSSDRYKSTDDTKEEAAHNSDRHRSKSSTDKSRSSEKTTNHHDKDTYKDDSEQHRSTKKDDIPASKLSHSSDTKSVDHNRSSHKSHKHSHRERNSSHSEDKESSKISSDYHKSKKPHKHSHREHNSSRSEDKESSRMSSDHLNSKNSQRHASSSSSGGSSHRHSSSTSKKDDLLLKESGGSIRRTEDVDHSASDRKSSADKNKLSSSEGKHSKSHHESKSSHKKHKNISSSKSHESELRTSSKESDKHKSHKHSKEKSHKRKRKISEGGLDGNDGQTFGDLMTSSCNEVPKKKKAPSLEQRIAKTVAEKPLPQSYLDDLPELLTDYKPLPKVNLASDSRHDKSAESNSDLAFSEIKASSRSESVYSGRRRGCSTLLSLSELCLHVLGNNIDEIGYVGGVPFSMLEPVLRKATARQLLTIEDYNTDFTEDSDPLWKEHCARDFKGQRPDEFESWRELYLRKYEEREKKLEMLQSKISAKEQQKSSEARKSQVAYAMASAPKPPREVRRQQAKYGTGSGSMESTARAAAIQKQEQSLRPYISKGGGSSSRESKPSVKMISLPPLMKKAKRFMSKLNR